MTKDIEREAFEEFFTKRHGELPVDTTSEKYADMSYLKHEMKKAWEMATTQLKGCLVVPVNNTTIVAIEKMVEQQVEASGITADVFRLDGEKILNAAVEAARGGNE